MIAVDSTEAFDVEIARLRGEVDRISALPATVSERFATVEAQLREAEQVYRTYGLNPIGAHAGEHASWTKSCTSVAVVGGRESDSIVRTIVPPVRRARISGDGVRRVPASMRLKIMQPLPIVPRAVV